MNLLAHAYLSGDNEYLMIGNFIADHIKGNNIDHFSPEVIKGIHLHRAIDHYTDHHPIFNRSCNRLHKKYHRYSGIIVDILYDHFLARHWREYHNQPLKEFTEKCYGTLLRHYNTLPQRTKSLLPHIMLENWLLAYYRFDGLERSFKGMSKRLKYNPGIEHAVEDLKAQYAWFEKDFRDFFPDLIFYTNKKIEELAGTPIRVKPRIRRRKRTNRFLARLRRQSDLPSSPEVK